MLAGSLLIASTHDTDRRQGFWLDRSFDEYVRWGLHVDRLRTGIHIVVSGLSMNTLDDLHV